MKNTHRWRKRRSPRLVASAYTTHEGGVWNKFPEQYGKISVRCLLEHLEFVEGPPEQGEFHYAGVALFFHSLKFVVPFLRNSTDISDRNVIDVTIWKLTGFQTPWRDEYADWSK